MEMAGEKKDGKKILPKIKEYYKLYGIKILIAVFLLGIVGTGFFLSKQTIKPNYSNNPSKPTISLSHTSTITPTLPPINKNVWKISIPDTEVLSDRNLSDNFLIYGVKKDFQTTVYKKNLLSGDEKIVIQFQESNKADKSGNLWRGLPPNIALSGDKKRLAFIDNEGLKILNLQSGNRNTLINIVRKPTSEERPPTWSEKSLSAYSLERPLWSSDGKYISFLESHYEGASFGLMNLDLNAYEKIKDLGGGYKNLSWSPTGHRYAKASIGGYEGYGLYTSSPENITTPDNIASVFGEKDSVFSDADFSPDNKRLVFSFFGSVESIDRTSSIPATVDFDGSNLKKYPEVGNAETPFFSKDGNSIFYIQNKDGGQVIAKSDLVSGEAHDLIILPKEFNTWNTPYWTNNGLLFLTGVWRESPLVMGGDKTRMFLIDLANNKVVYASPVFENFTTFAGFTDIN